MTDKSGVSPNTLKVGSRPGAPVVMKMGPFVQEVDPATARGYAVALIHAAEVAGLPPEPPPEGARRGLKLVA